MKNCYYFLMLLFFNLGLAQEKIDSLLQLDKTIPDENFEMVYQYNLPEWGYQRLDIAFSGSNSTSDKSEENIYDRYNGLYYSILPKFKRYYESESLIYTVGCDIQLDGSKYSKEINKYYEIDLTKSSRIDLNSMYYINLKTYFNKKNYIEINTENTFDYYDYFYKTNIDSKISKSSYFSRTYNYDFNIGIGYGKIRNIGPSIKAIRFGERLKSLRNNPQLTNNDLYELANLYASQTSYLVNYDRSTKYFYNNLPKNIQVKLASLKPWEILYLNEVNDEIIGQRYEGSSLSAGLKFNYLLSKGNRILNKDIFLPGVYLSYKKFHNYSSRFQLGIIANQNYEYDLKNNSNFNQIFKTSLTLQNLINLTDNLLFTTDIKYDLLSVQFEKNTVNEKYGWKYQNNLITHLNLNYFIENNISLYGNLNWLYLKRNSDSFYLENYQNYYYSDLKKKLSYNISFGINIYFANML